jgi:hypothetical protein
MWQIGKHNFLLKTMKSKFIRITGLFIILFSVISLGTAKFESAWCGNNTIGFPFTFYKYLGGDFLIEPVTRTYFTVGNLLLDILFALLLSGLIDFVIFKNKFIKRTLTKTF